MAGLTGPDSASPPFRIAEAQRGFLQLRFASFVGLGGQVLIWGSVLALWLLGSVYGGIPVETNIAYGAHGITISAGGVFGLYYLLILGALVSLISLELSRRGFLEVARARLPTDAKAEAVLTVFGEIGFGSFALGSIIWLGSFVAPWSGVGSSTTDYTSVMAGNLAELVDVLLILGGFLAFVGLVGIAVGNSKIGSAYEETTIELGGGLAVLPVFSIIGYALAILGCFQAGRKLQGGWEPPPPPPPTVYQSSYAQAATPTGAPVYLIAQKSSWDGIAVVLVVIIVLLWALLVPISVILSEESNTYGPSNGPGGGSANSTYAGSAAPSTSSPVVPVALLALVATGVLLPLVIVRNRRKRQRSATPVAPPPPPRPPPPRPPPTDEDPLNHLV